MKLVIFKTLHAEQSTHNLTVLIISEQTYGLM